MNTTKREKAVKELVLKKCWEFFADFLTDESKDIFIKTRIIKRLFKLNPSIDKVSLCIRGKLVDFNLKYNRRECPELRIWRKQVFERDKYICQKCRQKGGNLQAHHIQRWVDYPKLRFILSNGRTLCKSCHSKTNKNKSENNAIC